MFRLLGTVPFWKRVITASTGDFDNGVWVEGTTTVEYEEYECRWQPYNRGETEKVLPSGVKGRDIINLWTIEELAVADDLENLQTPPDIIYLENPNTNPNAVAYSVEDKEDWNRQGSFRLISSDFNVYTCRRVPKGTQL